MNPTITQSMFSMLQLANDVAMYGHKPRSRSRSVKLTFYVNHNIASETSPHFPFDGRAHLVSELQPLR